MTPFKFTNLGYKKPVLDVRNWHLESVQPTQPFPAVVTTDISPFKVNPNIYMQGTVPDCVQNAVCFAYRFIDWKATGKISNPCRRGLAIRTVAADGLPYQDGTNLQACLKLATKQGIGDAQYFPDDHGLDLPTFYGAPLPQPYIESEPAMKIPTYAQVTDLSVNGLKNAINQNGIVLIGIDVSDSWWTALDGTVSWDMNDVLPIRPPTAANPVVSGHAIALYAYDETYFYFCNWWSGGWGEAGRGWFGVNDLPEVYEAFVVGNFTQPAPPAPTPAKVVNAPIPVDNPIAELVKEVVDAVESLV